MKQMELYFLLSNIFTFIGIGIFVIYIIAVVISAIRDVIEAKKKSDR